MQEKHDNLLLNLKRLQSALIELVREGILLISDTLQPIYLNLKAKEIYDQLWDGSQPSTQLPPILSDISHQLFNDFHPDDEPLIIDHQVSAGKTVRIRVCQFTLRLDQEIRESSYDRRYILVFLEDRNATLAEELKVKQKKYDLTERETQLLHLLLQEYSYQHIAKTLQISLNTVKFHVKNIHFKKRNHLEQGRD
jgi:DNA-binding CsgD family transcriptional regulator